MPRRSKWTEEEWETLASRAVSLYNRKAKVTYKKVAKMLGVSTSAADNMVNNFKPKYFKIK